jgi:hypothetical protein
VSGYKRAVDPDAGDCERQRRKRAGRVRCNKYIALVPTNVELDTIYLTQIGQPLAEIVSIWHFGDCFFLLEAFLPKFFKSLLLAPVAFGQKLSSFFLLHCFYFHSSFFIRSQCVNFISYQCKVHCCTVPI